MSVCEITILGNVGRDPEMRYTPNGKPVTDLSVAVNQSRPDGQGGWTDETDWFRVAVFGDQAERVAENVRRGNKVLVIGHFKSREWEDRDGNKRTSLEVAANKVQSVERRPRDGEDEGGGFEAARPRAASGFGTAGASASELDDLPF